MALTGPRGSLTREGFERLLDFFAPDRERAGERYEELRRRLMKIFEFRGCAAPEDLADETLDRVARRLSEGEAIRADDPMVYLYGVARNVLREVWAQRRRAERPGDAPPGAAVAGEEDEPAVGRRLVCLEHCLDRLEPETRHFVLRYYSDEKRARIDARREMAGSLGIGIGALRIRMHRLRARLEVCVKACLAGSHETQPRAAHTRVRPEDRP